MANCSVALFLVLITKHLPFSLPYRALFSSSLRAETADRLLDALALLSVQLHLIGFSWNDISLSNTLFLRDAGSFAAYLVDAETGELHPALSNGQSEYDLETAATNVAGELMDLAAGGRLQVGIDPIVTGVGLRIRYGALRDTITKPVEFTRESRLALEKQIRKLNRLGFDVAELQVDAADSGDTVRISPKVLDAGHSVPFAEVVDDYVANVLKRKPEEKAVLGSRIGTPSDATAQLRIVISD